MRGKMPPPLGNIMPPLKNYSFEKLLISYLNIFFAPSPGIVDHKNTPKRLRFWVILTLMSLKIIPLLEKLTF